jgi:ketosteroid isomerase-like protein
MTSNQKQQLAWQFLSILGKPDEELVKSIVTDDVVWSFPGVAAISGEAHGVAGIMVGARAIATHQVQVEILRPVYGFNGIAMILHNTGTQRGHDLDAHLAAVFTFREDRIARLETYLSDVAMMEAFFA